MLKCVLLITMVCSMLSTYAYDCQVGGIYYSLDKTGSTASVTSCDDIKYKGEVVIPKTINVDDVSYVVKTIEAGAFSDCTELTAVTIGEAIQSIETSAFDGCSGLVSVTFNAEMCTRMGEQLRPVFSECPNFAKLTIGKGVTNIPYYAFMNCTGLTSITISEGAAPRISNAAFANCTGLTSIYFPKSVENVAAGAFSGCINLESIVVDPENPYMDSRDNCNALINNDNVLFQGCKNTIIPNTVIAILNRSFKDMTSLTSIRIPESVEAIYAQAFMNTGLTSVYIPKSVKTLNGDAFAGCANLENIVVDPENPRIDSRDNCNAVISTKNNKLVSGCKSTIIPGSVTSIGSNAFYGCTGLTSIAIPDAVTTIDNSAFEGCTGLTSIDIPNAVTTIGAFAFYGCTGLTSIAIPDAVTTIGRSTFYGCTGLTAVTLPKSVTAIGISAFEGCTELVKLVSPATTPPVCGENAFKGVDGNTCELFVPKESIDLYKAAEQWKDFARISEYGGVENVCVDTHSAVYEVYNLQGVRVGAGMREAEISADILPHGVYILVSPQGCKKLKI